VGVETVSDPSLKLRVVCEVVAEGSPEPWRRAVGEVVYLMGAGMAGWTALAISGN